MRLSFSTIGCPGWGFSEITAAAQDIGFDGIELRGVGSRLYTPRCREFSKEMLPESKKRLNDLRLTVPAISTGAVLGDPNPVMIENSMMEAKETAWLANELGCPTMRLMCSPVPEPGEIDLALCAEKLAVICDFCAPLQVVPLIETNGVLADSKQMAALLKQVNRSNLGVLWDVHHPFRFFGETPGDTAARLGKHIKHVHIKDSIADRSAPNGVRYTLMGYGDVPVENTVLALKNIGYNGFLSLEWVKRWNPELEEPGIVFAQYKNYMREII